MPRPEKLAQLAPPPQASSASSYQSSNNLAFVPYPFADTESPRVLSCPTSFEVRLKPAERDRRIFWQEPLFADNVGIEHTYKSREPGQSLHPGDHNVRYIASDGAGNRAECHFTIHVRETDGARRGSPMTPDLEPRQSYQRMLICPNRAPQQVPLSHRWQIPSGCYMRYTRLFSSVYSLQRYSSSSSTTTSSSSSSSTSISSSSAGQYQRGSEYQNPSAYREIHPMRRAPLAHTRAYPLVDYDGGQSRQQRQRHQQLQLQRPRDQVYYPRSSIRRVSHDRQPYGLQTRLLQTRHRPCLWSTPQR